MTDLEELRKQKRELEAQQKQLEEIEKAEINELIKAREIVAKKIDNN